MSKEITEIVRELREDHNNMRVLLDLLEQEANVLFAGDDPDYELLHNILHYMTTYPDAVHHPKEDLLYEEIRTVRPDLSQGFQRISMDHRNLADAGRVVRDKLAAISAGGIVDRKIVVADALRYVDTLRSHMQWEELDLFRRCLKMAREGHEFLSADEFADSEDPLFGETVKADFEGLYQRIRLSGKQRATVLDETHLIV